jgi:hypothetical protein
LEHDLAAQAKSLPKLCRALQKLSVGHAAVRLHHDQRPFRDLPRGPATYWPMFRYSRLTTPAPMFNLGALKTRAIVVAPPQVQIDFGL